MTSIRLNVVGSNPERDLHRKPFTASTDTGVVLPQPTKAYKMFQRNLKIVSMFGSPLGYELSYDWKHSNGRFIFTKSMMALLWVLIFYTQCLFIYQHTTVRTLEVFALYGIGISQILKIRCFQKYFKNITALIKSTLQICEQCTGRRGEKLSDRQKENFKFGKFLLILTVPVTGIYFYYPVTSYIVYAKFVQFVPLEIMFIDQSTTSGYCIASAIMVISGVLTVFQTLFIGLTFTIIILNYVPRVDLLEADFNELDKMWSDDVYMPETVKSTIAYRHTFLRNMCLKCIDMRLYVTELETIYSRKLFIFFIFAYLSQILCLHQVQVNDWIPGYSLAIGFFLEMTFYCILGTKLSMENDRLCYVITQSEWYSYDIRSQKIMLIILNLAQNSVELWIGPFKPLSVLTAIEMIKSVFSYYMVLVEVM